MSLLAPRQIVSELWSERIKKYDHEMNDGILPQLTMEGNSLSSTFAQEERPITKRIQCTENGFISSGS